MGLTAACGGSSSIISPRATNTMQQQHRRYLASFFAAAAATCCSVLLLLSLPAGAAAARPLIDPMKHDIGVVTQATWSGKVLKFRDTTVFSVLFYRPSDKESKTLIDGEYDTFAKKMKGIVQVLAVDCDENPKLCKDNNASQLPQIIIFPPFPLPPFPHQARNKIHEIQEQKSNQ